MEDSKIFTSKIEDKINQSRNNFYITSTGFLDMHEISIATDICKKEKDINAFFYGGYNNAERKILIISPCEFTSSFEEIIKMEEFFTLIKIRTKGSVKLTHRDYLGSVLSLGLKRNVIGDITVLKNGADMIVKKGIEKFLLSEYVKVGKMNVKLSVCDISEFIPPKLQKTILTKSISSLRLDNIVVAAFSVSRSNATEAVKKGRIFLDHTLQNRIDRKVEEGQSIVYRGKGKAILTEVVGTSKKGRQIVKIEKYI